AYGPPASQSPSVSFQRTGTLVFAPPDDPRPRSRSGDPVVAPQVAYEPDLLWDGTRFMPGALHVHDDGTIAADGLAGARVRLPGKALLPGLVNAHSHAFQRLLRGFTEHSAAVAPEDDFWSWRERMYTVTQKLSPEGLYAASRQAFVEMALCGIT